MCLAMGLVIASSGLEAQIRRVHKSTLELALDRVSYAPGDTARLAAVVTVEDGWHIQSNTPSLEYLIPTEFSLTTPPNWGTAEVSYPEHRMWQAGFASEKLAVFDGQTLIHATFQIPEDATVGSTPLDGSLFYQACDDRVCLPPIDLEAFVVLTVGERGEENAPHLFTSTASDSSGTPGPRDDKKGAAPLSAGRLLVILGLGVLGGLILNAMPCVLPVLSLKVFGLVQDAGHGTGYVRRGSLATAFGILVSFWVLAGLAIAARSAGEAVGWGIQFQNPVFVAALTAVMVLFCLNLWGLFEVPLPRFLSSVASQGENKDIAGHFSTGLFATLMATPCSAPFLGIAIGFALSQPAMLTLLVFTAVGVGMALPYLLLAAAPGAASILPRPGAWMETLKGAMGFLLAGTAVWLLYILAGQLSSARLALVEGGLLALAGGVWLRSGATGKVARVVGLVGAIAAVVATLAIAHTGRGISAGERAPLQLLTWESFDRARAERLAAEEGRLVFVDVTADWCATCKVNERVVLETEPIRDLFDRHDVLTMKADWTNRNDEIATFLADFGRYAIPFYVLYRPGQEPHVFGELLTRSTVVDVVEETALAIAAASSDEQDGVPRPAG